MYAAKLSGSVYPYTQPYPQPYAWPTYGPPPGPPPRAKTPQGLHWALAGLVLAIAYSAVSALIGLLLGQILSGPPPPPGNVLNQVSGMLAAGILSLILGILVLIFYFIGFGFLYGGRNEFGPTHARNVRIALFLVIGAIALGVASEVAVFIINLQGFRVSFGFPITVEVDPAMFYLGVVVRAILDVTVAALVAAHIVLAVRSLAKPQHEVVLYVAAAVGTATPGIVGALTLLQMPRFIVFLETIAEAAAGGGIPSTLGADPSFGVPMIVGGILGVIAGLLFLWVFVVASARLRTGELRPVLPTPEPVMPGTLAPPPPPAPPAAPSGPAGPAT